MSKTTNITTTIAFDEEKLTTLNVYLAQNNQNLDTLLVDVLNETMDKLFTKTVPAAVQNFIALKNGIDLVKSDKSESRLLKYRKR